MENHSDSFDDNISSPDPLALSPTTSSPLKHLPARQTRTQPLRSTSGNARRSSSTTFQLPVDRHGASPSKSIFLSTGGAGPGSSPWKIKVTVEAEPEDGANDDDMDSPTRGRTTSVKVPLRDEGDVSPPKRMGRGRGRISEAGSTPKKRKGTPAKRRQSQNPTEDEGDDVFLINEDNVAISRRGRKKTALPAHSESNRRRQSGRSSLGKQDETLPSPFTAKDTGRESRSTGNTSVLKPLSQLLLETDQTDTTSPSIRSANSGWSARSRTSIRSRASRTQDSMKARSTASDASTTSTRPSVRRRLDFDVSPPSSIQVMAEAPSDSAPSPASVHISSLDHALAIVGEATNATGDHASARDSTISPPAERQLVDSVERKAEKQWTTETHDGENKGDPQAEDVYDFEPHDVTHIGNQTLEDMTMVTIESLPSMRRPVRQMEATPAAAQAEVTDARASPEAAVPVEEEEGEGEVEEEEPHIPTPEPTESDFSDMVEFQQSPSARLSDQTPDPPPLSAASKPPAVSVVEPQSTTPELAFAVQAGIALQGVVVDATARTPPKKLSGLKDRIDLFSPFGEDSQRGLRDALRLGEELAKNAHTTLRDEISPLAGRGSESRSSDEIFTAPLANGKRQVQLHRGPPEFASSTRKNSQVSYPSLNTYSSNSHLISPEQSDADEMDWRADTPPAPINPSPQIVLESQVGQAFPAIREFTSEYEKSGGVLDLQQANPSPKTAALPHEDGQEDFAEDIWQEEASRSSDILPPRTSRARDSTTIVPLLFQDAVFVKPPRAKLPRTWRRVSATNFSYSDEAEAEADGSQRSLGEREPSQMDATMESVPEVEPRSLEHARANDQSLQSRPTDSESPGPAIFMRASRPSRSSASQNDGPGEQTLISELFHDYHPVTSSPPVLPAGVGGPIRKSSQQVSAPAPPPTSHPAPVPRSPTVPAPSRAMPPPSLLQAPSMRNGPHASVPVRSSPLKQEVIFTSSVMSASSPLQDRGMGRSKPEGFYLDYSELTTTDEGTRLDFGATEFSTALLSPSPSAEPSIERSTETYQEAASMASTDVSRSDIRQLRNEIRNRHASISDHESQDERSEREEQDDKGEEEDEDDSVASQLTPKTATTQGTFEHDSTRADLDEEDPTEDFTYTTEDVTAAFTASEEDSSSGYLNTSQDVGSVSGASYHEIQNTFTVPLKGAASSAEVSLASGSSTGYDAPSEESESRTESEAVSEESEAPSESELRPEEGPAASEESQTPPQKFQTDRSSRAISGTDHFKAVDMTLPARSGIMGRVAGGVLNALSIIGPEHPGHPLLRKNCLLPRLEPWTRTHYIQLDRIYQLYKQQEEAFDPGAPWNIGLFEGNDFLRFDEVEYFNWGYYFKFKSGHIVIAALFYKLLKLKDIDAWEALYKKPIDDPFNEPETGRNIDEWTIMLKLMAVIVGEFVRSDRRRGYTIDMREGQQRWRLKGEKSWIMAANYESRMSLWGYRRVFETMPYEGRIPRAEETASRPKVRKEQGQRAG